MGGIPTDTDARVVVGTEDAPVPGLYAAGECACVSVHGANRLGTNSLLDIVVFGRRGGRDMARYASQNDLASLPPHPETATLEELRELLRGPNLEFAADIRTDLQMHMFDLCGVVRTEKGLLDLQRILAGLRDRYRLIGVHDRGKVFNTELMEAVELGFLLDISDAVVAAALTRDESRGGHYREDHPLRDDDHWLLHSLAYREDDGGVRMEYKDVKLGPYIPMERKY
jgi:succinate dehydrogenase / fumarate reductase flavoprotein subunit